MSIRSKTIRRGIERLKARIGVDGLFREFGNDLPLRSELFSLVQLEEHAQTLAAWHEIDPLQGPDKLLTRLTANENVLREAYKLMLDAVQHDRHVVPAGEWLLDNYYLIEEQIRMSRRHLPKQYSRGLPRLLNGPSAGYPCVYDLALELIATSGQLTVAALGGNAGAGGCFLARAADRVWARESVLLNPHYRNMGNLYGSEYWTYLLPRRVGEDAARALMRERQPLTARRALQIGFVDDCLGGDPAAYAASVSKRAQELAAAPDWSVQIAAKREARARDEATKPLAAYRDEELAQMRRNFYGFDPSYHVARHHFVRKSPVAWTPRHLARHRELGWVVPASGGPP